MSRRIPRVNELIKEELGKAIYELYASEKALITVTQVVITKDLKSAKVGISVVPLVKGVLPTEVIFQLQASGPKLQQMLAKKVTLKFIPTLTFIHDTGAENAKIIDEILERIHVQKETR